MNRLRRVVSNTVISLVGQGVTWTSTLLLTMAYGRFLGDVKFGELYFATTFVLLMGIPIQIQSGYDQQTTRAVAQEPGAALRYSSNVFLIKVGIWLVIYSLTLLLAWLLGYSAEVRTLIGISGFTLLSSAIGSTFASLHYALERVIFPVVGSILEKVLSAFLGILLLRNGAGVQVMALVLLGGSIAGGIWQAIWFYQKVGTGFVVDQALIRELIRTNIPFLIYGVLSVIYYRIDIVLLSFMTNDTVVGWYGAAYRLFDTLTFLPNLVISTIMYPIFSKLSVTSESDLKLAVEKSVNFLLFCGIPITTALIVLAPNIIAFLYYRTEFTHATPALEALAPGLILLYINTALGSTILSKRQDRKIPIMAAAALVFNLGLNLIFIPLYQHVGAAIVTSLTELLLLFIAVAFIPKHLLPLGSLQVGAKALVASLVMAAIIWYLRTLNIFALLPTGMFVYLGAAMLLKTIPSEDMQALYKVMPLERITRPLSISFIRNTGSEYVCRYTPGDVHYDMLTTSMTTNLRLRGSTLSLTRNEHVSYRLAREMTLRRTLEAVFHRPKQLLTLLILLPLIGLATAFLLPRSYESTARLWALRNYDSNDQADLANDPSATPAHTQATALAQLLQTRTFALTVAHETALASTLTLDANTANNPQLLDDALFRATSQGVQVTDSGNNLVIVDYKNRDPKVAQQVVAAVVQQYAGQAQKIALNLGQQQLKDYQSQLAKTRNDLSAAQAAESEYIAAHPEPQGKLQTDPQYTLLHARTIQAQTQLQDIQATIDTIYREIAQQGSTNSLFEVLDAPVVAVQPVSRLALFLIAGGIGLGLALLACSLYIIILVRRDRAVYTPLDVQNVLALPVVAQLPHLAPTTVSALIDSIEY